MSILKRELDSVKLDSVKLAFEIRVYEDYLRQKYPHTSYEVIKQVTASTSLENIVSWTNKLPKQSGFNNLTDLKNKRVYPKIWCNHCRQSNPDARNPIGKISPKYVECANCNNVQLYVCTMCYKCGLKICMVVIDDK